MPALREISEDIPVLANHFLQKHCAAMSMETKEFTPAALDRLSRYHWPGNARQLENEVKRLIASVRGRTISEDHIAVQGEQPELQAEPLPPSATASGKSLFEAVEALERQMIEQAIKDVGGNKQRAAS
jgi:DNA-binding NtrC family response regulator